MLEQGFNDDKALLKQVKPGFTNYQREVWPIKFDFLKIKKDLELKNQEIFIFYLK